MLNNIINFVLNFIYINIKLIPIKTWNIWNEVNIKKFENKIEFEILNIKNLNSKIWIKIKYNLNIIDIFKNNFIFKFISWFKYIDSIIVILEEIKIIELVNAIKKFKLNIFKLLKLIIKLLK